MLDHNINNPTTSFLAAQARRAESEEKYYQASQTASLNWDQLVVAQANWRAAYNSNATDDEKNAAYESYSKAQDEYYNSYSEAIQAMKTYNEETQIERDAYSSGTFSAFEAMDVNNNWQKENAVKQTELLKEIKNNTELSAWV